MAQCAAPMSTAASAGRAVNSPTRNLARSNTSTTTQRFPAMDLTDPTWGDLVGTGWSFELNIGSDDPMDSIMLHVRGSGDGVIPIVLEITDVVGGRAIDTAAGLFLEDDNQTEGWHQFQAFRDQILRPLPGDRMT